MTSFHRIKAIIEKDFSWAKGNMKLLGLMVFPLFFVVLFSKVDSDATFTYAITFVISFVGLLTTSYLIIEEKNQGTLLALLTSPLRNHELLIGKFALTLFLCTLFSLFAIFVNNRIDILSNPLVLLNFLFFSGTACFLGYIMGVFFKNEQEMSVAAPLILVVFFLGETFNRVSDSGNPFAYFPDYHFAKSITTVNPPFNDLMVHLIFNLVYFLGALFLASWYTQFYFSNNNEKRSSRQFIGYLVGFMGLFIVSGLTTPALTKTKSKAPKLENISVQSVQSPHWSFDYKFDPKRQSLKLFLESKDFKIYQVKQKKSEENVSLFLNLKMTSANQSTPQLREQNIRKPSKRTLFGKDHIYLDQFRFSKWSYYQEKKWITRAEAFCGPQLLQIIVEYENPEMEKIPGVLDRWEQVLKNLVPHCRPS